jgi:hypothetical protein
MIRCEDGCGPPSVSPLGTWFPSPPDLQAPIGAPLSWQVRR